MRLTLIGDDGTSVRVWQIGNDEDSDFNLDLCKTSQATMVSLIGETIISSVIDFDAHLELNKKLAKKNGENHLFPSERSELL